MRLDKIPRSSKSKASRTGAKAGRFRREWLPTVTTYYQSAGMKLTGRGQWRNAICTFHIDHNPSLRVHIASGGYPLHVCGEHGGDVLAFHMRRHAMRFIEAAKAPRAWEEVAQGRPR
jgi:hypothetical protein